MVEKINTDRLILREVLAEDAGFYYELMNTDTYHRFIGYRAINSDEDALNYIQEKVMPTFSQYGYGMFTVTLKSGTLIGVCGIVRRDSLPSPDLGFAFLPQYEGNGYAFESASAVVKLAFNEYQMDRLLAITDLKNVRSRRLLEKLNFKLIPSDNEKLLQYCLEP